MNRHQSNPFLAGWEEAEDRQAAMISGVFDMDTAADDGNANQASLTSQRRHSSSSQSEAANPFRAQRAGADRRLYHRNMSSFEAASLQLEQQQMMQENGANGSGLSSEQTELIAKMTADFQSAIETNDKQFDQQFEGEPIDGFNPFDPFETIVDDDVSIPSPGGKWTSSNQQAKPALDRGVDLDFSGGEGTRRTNLHDSIDDDDDELVSTPVRNIKSVCGDPARRRGSAAVDTQQSSGQSNENSEQQQVTCGESEPAEMTTDSIQKATLMASLLATAEPPNVKASDLEELGREAGDNIEEADNSRGEARISPQQVDNPTHVIKGSPASGESRASSRPVGYFDPFETVIDKDALSSLMNTNDTNNKSDYLKSSSSSSRETRTSPPGPIAESVSIETVIENTAATIEQTPSSIDEPKESRHETPRAVLRPTPVNRPRVQLAEDTSAAPASTRARKTKTTNKTNNSKKKSQFQQDSSSSSDNDDDRIQIVIRARDASKQEAGSGGESGAPVLVPLLPPPPSKSSMKQARERGQVDDIPSPIMSYKTRQERRRNRTTTTSAGAGDSDWTESDDVDEQDKREPANRDDQEAAAKTNEAPARPKQGAESDHDEDEDNGHDDGSEFVIPMTHDDSDGDLYAKPETPLYDDDTSYVLEEFPAKYEGDSWEMMLRYPPKKKLTSNRFWKKIYVRLAQVPLAPDNACKSKAAKTAKEGAEPEPPQTCIALQVYDKPEDKKPMQEIPIQATYTVSEISSQQFDQFGKIFTIKLQYIFYKERVGVRQGQLARFIHTGHIGSSTTSGGHGVDPISIGAIKRMGAPIEHSPQISQIIKLGCTSYEDIKAFKNCLEDHLFKMPIHRDRALSTYKTEEVQMAVRDETYVELNQIGQITRQLARVRLFFLSFLNGTPTVEVGINDIHRQGREVVGRMDILPVVTEEWIRLEAWELHPTVDKETFEDPELRMIRLVPPDATFFEVMRFRVRPPRNRELPLQISANMQVTRTKVCINCEVMVPGEVSRKHGQIPCENIAIRVDIPECWIYFFREEKHFRMGSKKSVNRRPGKVKGIERFLGGGGGLQDFNDDSSLIEVTSGQAKYEHHHHAIVWRAARWPKESQSAYVQNTMKIRLPLTAYDKMPDNFYEYIHVEYTMPATTVSHTTLRSISVNPCDDEPAEKYVKYASKYEYKVKMRLSVNVSNKPGEHAHSQLQLADSPPIIIMKQPDKEGDLEKEEDIDDDDDDDDVNDANEDIEERERLADSNRGNDSGRWK